MKKLQREIEKNTHIAIYWMEIVIVKQLQITVNAHVKFETYSEIWHSHELR